jgi:hypothetical protein
MFELAVAVADADKVSLVHFNLVVYFTNAFETKLIILKEYKIKQGIG